MDYTQFELKVLEWIREAEEEEKRIHVLFSDPPPDVKDHALKTDLYNHQTTCIMGRRFW